MLAITKPKQNLTNVKQRKARWGKGARSPLAEKGVTSVTRVTGTNRTQDGPVIVALTLDRFLELLKQSTDGGGR